MFIYNIFRFYSTLNPKWLSERKWTFYPNRFFCSFLSTTFQKEILPSIVFLYISNRPIAPPLSLSLRFSFTNLLSVFFSSSFFLQFLAFLSSLYHFRCLSLSWDIFLSHFRFRFNKLIIFPIYLKQLFPSARFWN